MAGRRNRNRRLLKRMSAQLSLLLLGATVLSCTGRNQIPVAVWVSSLSISKLPFVIAEDQGLYEKYGLAVEFRTGPPPFDGGKQGRAGFWTRAGQRLGIVEIRPFEIWVQGATPSVVNSTLAPRGRDLISIAATDCVVRSHIVGRHGISKLEDLRAKRLGVSNFNSTAGFIGRLLAERMGWDPVQDISIMADSHEVNDLRDGLVDATVAYEMGYAVLKQEGFPILADTITWNDQIGGNSVLVERTWLTDPANREAARRFLMALAEGVALFHENHDLTLQVLDDWYGIEDREFAETVYARGAWIPREPYPCYEGIRRTMELYDSNEMRRHKPEDFYDDSVVRELIESGFINKLYQ